MQAQQIMRAIEPIAGLGALRLTEQADLLIVADRFGRHAEQLRNLANV